MLVSTIALLVVLALTALLAALNWSAFVAPVALWLGVATVDAPLGLLLLGALALVALISVAAAIATQARVDAEARRRERELSAMRELADQAEASRFTELREFVGAELTRVVQASDASRDGVLARVERMESQLRLLIEQTGNTLSAYIGQLEERVDGGRRDAWPPRSQPLQPPPR